MTRARPGGSDSGRANVGGGRVALRAVYGWVFPLVGGAASAEEERRVTIVMGGVPSDLLVCKQKGEQHPKTKGEREMSVRSIRTSVGWSALSSAVSSVVIIILGLVSGWEAAEWLALVAGLWVGLFLAWVAFRFFGWRRVAANLSVLWGIVGGVLVFVVLFVVGSMVFGVLPATPAVGVIFWTVCGIGLSAVGTAAEIDRRLQDEGYSR
jgi:hypothetical protein